MLHFWTDGNVDILCNDPEHLMALTIKRQNFDDDDEEEEEETYI